MTRKEEIVDAAKKAAEEVYSYTFQGMDDLIGLFKAGAEWADEHPIHYDGQAMLHVLHKGVEQGKKEMIYKIKSLIKEWELHTSTEAKYRIEAYRELLDNFMKSMEE